jgi:hypothetical protein
MTSGCRLWSNTRASNVVKPFTLKERLKFTSLATRQEKFGLANIASILPIIRVIGLAIINAFTLVNMLLIKRVKNLLLIVELYWIKTYSLDLWLLCYSFSS